MLNNFQAKTFIVIFFLFFNGKILGQPTKNRSLDPVIKSFLVPGWGQNELGYKKRSKIYGYLEVGILVSIYTSSKYSNEIKRNYIAYASEHAGVVSEGKDREFWVDIGNYNTLNEYNDEHLRNRESSDLYPQNSQWNWEWDSSDKRRFFE